MIVRRRFIKSLVAGGILLPSIPQFLLGVEKGMDHSFSSISDGSDMKEIRIALIGKGGMGTADTNTGK